MGKTCFTYNKAKVATERSGLEVRDETSQTYTQEMFEGQELAGYPNKNMLETQKLVFDHVVYDSDIEFIKANDYASFTAQY